MSIEREVTIPDRSLRRLTAAAPSVRTVGRESVLAQLDAHVGIRGGAALLAGGPGAGKSHLARTVIGRMVAQGATSEAIQGGTASGKVPLGPCAHLVPVLTGSVPLAGLIAAALDGQRRRAAYQPLVILAEDVDRLDDASATLVGHFIGAAGIAVVLTARDPGALPAPLAGLVGDGSLPVVKVDPLTPDSIAELAAQSAGGPLDPESAWLLYEVTGGNPLWVTEIIRSAVTRRALTATSRGLRLPAEATVGGLYEVLDARLLELTETERDTLSLLSVGGSLPASVLDAMVGADVPVRLAAVGLVSATIYNGMANVRLTHPLYRQVLLQRLSQLEIRLILRRLIAASEVDQANGGLSRQDRTMVIRLALWHSELGESFDPEALGWAAQTVQWGLLDVVRRHLSPGGSPGAATDAGVELGLQLGEERAAAAYRLAAAAWRQGPTFESGIALARSIVHQPRYAADMIALLEAMHELASSDEERAHLGIVQAIWLFWTSRQRDVAFQELDALAPTLQPPWDRMVMATRGGLTLQAGAVGESLAILDAAAPAPTAPPLAKVVYGSPRAAALIMAGRMREGVELAEEMLPIAFQQGGSSYASMGELLISSHWGKLWLGRYESTRTSALDVAELLVGTDDESLSLFLGNAARCLLGQGRPASAAAELEKAIRSHGPAATFGFRPLLYTTLAMALSWLGRPEEAAAASIEARRWNMPPRFFDADLDLADAYVLAAEGRRSRAARLAEDVRVRSKAEGNGSYQFAAAYLAARLRPSVVSQRELAAAVKIVDLPVAELALRHVAALMDGDPGDLEDVAAQAIALDEQLLAVEILEAAVARAREVSTGSVHLRTTGALRAQRVRCEQARSPIVGLPTGPTGLTAREQEIASLAAVGWTSAAIAEELVLSVRTVESHLYRTFAKLGIRSRDELEKALDRAAFEAD